MESEPAVGVIRKKAVPALAVALLLAGAFASGFVACLHSKSAVSSDLRQRYLSQAGDATSPVRADVLAALRAFQEGYIRRDPQQLDAFMHRLFPANDDILLLGTDAGEWVRGYPAVAEFIRADWARWGDVRLAVDDAIVCSSGDVAWIASVGSVRGQRSDRPLRFSAILTRNGGHWVFRQLQFQWDDRDPRPADLLRPGTYFNILSQVRRLFAS